MITVLKNRSEVDDALSTLRADELPLHVTPQKNWDHLLIKDLIQELVDEWGKDLRILDMGSVLLAYNAWYGPSFTPEDIEEIVRLVEIHDNPSIQAYQNMSETPGSKVWLFDPDDHLMGPRPRGGCSTRRRSPPCVTELVKQRGTL